MRSSDSWFERETQHNFNFYFYFSFNLCEKKTLPWPANRKHVKWTKCEFQKCFDDVWYQEEVRSRILVAIRSNSHRRHSGTRNELVHVLHIKQIMSHVDIFRISYEFPIYDIRVSTIFSNFFQFPPYQQFVHFIMTWTCVSWIFRSFNK